MKLSSESPRFWPAIDDGLRRAAYERGVKVRLLVSCWGHSEPSMRAFLHSRAALRDNHTHSDIQVVSAPPALPLGPEDSPQGAHLSPDRDDPDGQGCAMTGRRWVQAGGQGTGRGGRAQTEETWTEASRPG